MNEGKIKCNILKSIRQDIAKQYDLVYNPEKCTNKGECSGTCPKYEAELADLQRQLDARGIKDIDKLMDLATKVPEIDPEDFTEIYPLGGVIVDYSQKQDERKTPRTNQDFF